MKENFDGFCIRCHDDELADSAVESFSRFVGALFEHFVVGGLLHEVEDLLCELGVGQGEGFGVDVGHR